ncbi:MAG: hypothetical protein AAB407_02490 [Patescibacteria group bacterium]
MIKGKTRKEKTRTPRDQVFFILRANGASTAESIGEEMDPKLDPLDLKKLLRYLVKEKQIRRQLSPEGNRKNDTFIRW